MYEGKEKRIQLINEIQSTHALHNEEMEIKRNEKAIILAHQRNQRHFENQVISILLNGKLILSTLIRHVLRTQTLDVIAHSYCSVLFSHLYQEINIDE